MGYTGCKTIEEMREKPEFVQVTGAGMAESHFPSFPNVNIRALCSTNLDGLEAALANVPLAVTHGGYNPERRHCTPPEEWERLVRASRNACIICQSAGVKHLFGPGMRLALDNRTKWHRIAANVDTWYMQLQIYQVATLPEFIKAVADQVYYLRIGRTARAAFHGPIIGQLSLAHNSPQEVYAQAIALEGIVTAVRFLHMKDIDALAQVLKLMYD